MKKIVVLTIFCLVCSVIIGFSFSASAQSASIPSWIKNNAKWWSDGTITDDDFLKGIQYLIDNNILKAPLSNPSTTNDENSANISISFDKDSYNVDEPITFTVTGVSEYANVWITSAGGFSIFPLSVQTEDIALYWDNTVPRSSPWIGEHHEDGWLISYRNLLSDKLVNGKWVFTLDKYEDHKCQHDVPQWHFYQCDKTGEMKQLSSGYYELIVTDTDYLSPGMPEKIIERSFKVSDKDQPVSSGIIPAQSPSISNTNSDTSPHSIAVIDTKFGEIKFKLLDDVAPKTTSNFVKLANSGFYDGTVFHRIVPGFVIQGGDPNTIKGDRNTWGLGDAGYTIPPEFSKTLQFSKYMVGMARGSDVNSGSSQFFITVGNAPWLNNQYTLFGQVISGQDVVDKIAALKTNPDTQPVDADSARVNKVTISSG